ncbi:MAG: type II toxin-antitoxin system VapC family toxin [Nitrososphaerota archaeon]|nr:type II toxin-antitoxin system VapC family toxin [Nitrososphaerota archaeon]
MVEGGLILIDTNVFLEVLLDQKKAGECKALLKKVSAGELEAVVSHFTVHAVEAQIGSGPGLVEFLRTIENSLGLSVHDTDLSDEIAASLLARSLGRDFDDSLQYYLAKKLGVEAIVSFDHDFDGLDLKRAEPSEVIASGPAEE